MNIRIWLIAFAAVLLCACAGSPQKPPVAARVPAPVATLPVATLPVATLPVTAPPVAAPTNAPYDVRSAEADKRAREMGYHVETRHGEKFYCRTTAPLGSRLTQKECLTVETMGEAARMADENKASQQQAHMCQGGGCIRN